MMSNEIKLREIRFGDFGLISRIVRKMELREELPNLFFSVDKEVSADEANLLETRTQADFAVMLIENYEKAEKDIQKLLANLSGKTVEEVEQFTFEDMSKAFEQLRQDENLPDFLKSALK